MVWPLIGAAAVQHFMKQQGQRQDEEGARRDKRASILQQSASRLGAPSTQGVDAARFKGRQEEDRRKKSRAGIMKLISSFGGGGGSSGGGVGGGY